MTDITADRFLAPGAAYYKEASLTYADFSIASTVQTQAVTAESSRVVLFRCAWFDLVTPFSGGLCASAIMNLIASGGPGRTLTAGSPDVFTGATTGDRGILTGERAVTAYDEILVAAAPSNITAQLVITGDTIDNLTAGEITLKMLYWILEV